MTPVEPTLFQEDGRLVEFAKHQPEYTPLPVVVSHDGLVMTEWEPTAEELARILSGGRVRIWLHTFGQPLPPLSVDIAEPNCGMRGE